jgi:hypothetical protein
MQATKIKTDYAYLIDYKALKDQYGYRAREIHSPYVARVVAKGVERHGSSRNDGVRIELTGRDYEAVKASYPEHMREQVAREFVVHSRAIVESKADHDRRKAEAEERQRQQEALQNQQWRDRAEGITPEVIGQMMEASDRSAASELHNYHKALVSLVQAAQDQIDRIENVADVANWRATLKDEDGLWPITPAHSDRVIDRFERTVKERDDYHRQASVANILRTAKSQED